MAVDNVVAQLAAMSVPVTTPERIAQVSHIHDFHMITDIGQLII